MPDNNRKKGDFDYLESRWQLGLPQVFASMALAGGVVLAAWLLKLGFAAFHLPFPGK